MSNRVALLILLSVSFILCLSWLRSGLIIGGAEERLSFYDPKRSSELYKYTWDKNISGPTTAEVSRYPFFLFLGIINNLGITSNVLQMITFFLLVLISALVIFFLAKDLLSLSPILSLISALFYILSPFMFSSIWHRYLVAMMFFMPLLPLSLYSFQRFINTKNMLMIPIFLGASFVFSPAFSLPSNILTLWIVVSVFVSGLILANIRKLKMIFFIIGWFILFFVFWLLTNSWWISSLSVQAGPEYSQYFSVDDNLFVLRSISQQYSFLNNITLGYPRLLSQSYQIITGYLILLICLIGIFALKNNKIKIFFVILLAVSYFVLNGSNGPLGQLFEFLFSNINFLQVYRNPYEKFGIVLAFLYSFLFSLGILFVYKFSKWFSLTLLSVVFLILFILPWTGQVFGDPGVNLYIRVPVEYEKVNKLLKTDTDEFRVLHIPMIPGGGLGYKWPNPYFGLTPSLHLFDKLSIDGSLSKKEPDLYRKALNEGLHTGSIPQLLKFGNIKYLLLHKDLDFNYAGSESVNEVQKYLSSVLTIDPGSRINICNDEKILRLIDGEGYSILCQLNNEYADWLQYNFLILELTSSGAGKLRVDIIDDNQSRLFFDGSLDDRYTILENETDTLQKFFLNLKVPTGRYGEFNSSRVAAVLIQYLPLENRKIDNKINILNITIERGKESQVTYLDAPIWYGDLGLFKIKSEYFYPKIYATSQIETIDDWSEIVRNEKNPKAFIFSRQKNTPVNYESSFSKLPELLIEKINPTKYIVKVQNATDPFWLVFSENFNPDWHASVNGRSFDHFQINGFANGYLVDQIGSYNLELEYIIQKRTEIYKIISIVSFILITLSSLTVALFKKNLSKIPFNL